MVFTLVLLFSLLSTPVATPMQIDDAPQWVMPMGVETTIQPLIVGDMVIVTNNDHTVLALDARTGELAWAVVGTERVSAPMAVSVDTLLLPGENGTLVALSLQTGELENAVVLGTEPLLEPMVIGESIIVSDENGTVHVIDGETLQVEASIVVGGTIRHVEAANNLAIVASNDGMVSAIDPLSATVQWRAVLSSGPAQALAIGDGIAFGLVSGDIIMLEAADGRIRWQQIVVASSLTDIASTGSEMLGITRQGDIMALDIATGAPAWREVLHTGGWFARDQCGVTCPIVTNDGSLLALDVASGGQLTPITVMPEVGAPPTATDDVLVAVTERGDVFAWVFMPE